MCFLLIDGAVMVANMKAKKFVNKLEQEIIINNYWMRFL